MAIVESTQYPLSDPLFDARPHQGSAAGHREVNLLAIAWRGRWLLLLLGMVGGGIGWAMFERTTPRYTSASRITVDSSTPRLLDEHYQTMASATYLDTQAACIRSSSVLQVAAKAPENADLESFRGVDDRVGFLRSNIQVFVGGKDDVITVLTELPNAADAAQLVNSVVEAYISKYAEQRRTVEILTILRNEKQRRDKELEDCRTELETFRKQHPELSVHVAEGNVITLRFASLSDELNRTEIELLQAKALFNRVKKMYDTPSQRPFLLELAANQQQTLRDVELERQVKTLEQSLVSERARWGEGHPRVRLLADSLDEMREELKKKQAAIIESFVESQRQNFELLDHKRIELQAAYDRQFEAASRVSTLVAQLDSLQEALLRAEEDCDNVEERIKSVNLAEEVGGSMQVRVLDPATASKVPTYPNRSRFLAMGILAGTLAGFGLAWIRDLLDHRLRSIDETAEVLQLPVLGMLPHMGIAHDQAHIGRLAALAPRSSISEAIRTLRTALHFGLAGNEAKTLCITSPAAGDGKSTVASN
ncbi:MAG TPA: hypothetical protein VEQ85_10785, partial [Lacipirellulaceae bacterium]|nr:hypothetical protein [Lacipirellulaceae bacterium]